MKYAEETKSLEVISEDRTEQILQICTNSQKTDFEGIEYGSGSIRRSKNGKVVFNQKIE